PLCVTREAAPHPTADLAPRAARLRRPPRPAHPPAPHRTPTHHQRWHPGEAAVQPPDRRRLASLFLHRPQHPLHDAIQPWPGDPADHDHQLVLGTHVDEVVASADVDERTTRAGFHLLSLVVQVPVHEAVAGLDGRGGEGHRHPLVGEDRLALPPPPVHREQPESSLVVCVDEEPSTPVGATADRLHRYAIEEDPGVVIAKPAPAVGGADRIEDVLLRDLRERTTPYIEDGEREQV